MSSSWVVKLERARELLDQLRGDIAAFVDERPFTLSERTTDTALHYELQVLASPPERLSVIAGEIAHDLRSALDHLMWHCVEANGSTPNRDTAFPIQRVADEEGFVHRRRAYRVPSLKSCARPSHIRNRVPSRMLSFDCMTSTGSTSTVSCM